MYFLSKDCFVCKLGSYWIILSARRDRYLCVAHADLASIGDQLHGWQDQSIVVPALPPTEAGANPFIESLISNAIITRDSTMGKSFAEPQYPVPERQMEPAEPIRQDKVSPLRIARFFLACATADWQLRTNALCRTLARVERRRLRAGSAPSVNNDVALALRLVGVFKSLRPLYPRPYLCLFDSLALLEFLAAYHLYPHVVFGVVADPFQAHCWLQDGATVCNDDLERVGRYRPILSI
jgi:Transglutaminase-like superfamily